MQNFRALRAFSVDFLVGCRAGLCQILGVVNLQVLESQTMRRGKKSHPSTSRMLNSGVTFPTAQDDGFFWDFLQMGHVGAGSRGTEGIGVGQTPREQPQGWPCEFGAGISQKFLSWELSKTFPWG